MFKKVIIAAMAVGLLATGFCFGAGYIQKTFQPQVITEYVTDIVEVPVEVPIEVIKEIPVEVVKEVPTKLRYFEDTDELEKFLEESDADHTKYIKATKEGVIDFRSYDCEDYAMALRDQAQAKGFHMNIQAVWHYRRPDTNELITSGNEGHALNSTIIGNQLYFIEPQSDDYWLAGYLDPK